MARATSEKRPTHRVRAAEPRGSHVAHGGNPVGDIRIEYVLLSRVVKWGKNPKLHAADHLGKSMNRWGFTSPILINETTGTLIAGHGRCEELERKKAAGEPPPERIRVDGSEWLVPVIRGVGFATDDEAAAYAVADNRLVELGGWDEKGLAEVMDGLLATTELGLEGIGYSDADLKDLHDQLNAEARAEAKRGAKPDDVPEVQKQAVSRTGDLWLLGGHRLLCGDSTKAEDVARVMGGQKADVCLTDPPYGIGDTVSTKNEYVEYEDTKENLVKLIGGFLPLAQKAAKIVVLTPGNSNQRLYPPPTWTMAWFVPAGTGCGPWGFICWQPILCYGKDPKLATGQGSHPDAIVHTEAAEKTEHPCSKPVGFWKWLMDRCSEVGQIIYEPFSGSGTAFVAGEDSGRVVRGIELSPLYVDVAIRRFQAFALNDAVLDGDGRTFAEVMAERLPSVHADAPQPPA